MIYLLTSTGAIFLNLDAEPTIFYDLDAFLLQS